MASMPPPILEDNAHPWIQPRREVRYAADHEWNDKYRLKSETWRSPWSASSWVATMQNIKNR